MAKIEPVYEPRDHEMGAFADDELEHEDEGSRLPLLIVIGLLVLAAFGGVVWLAYQHGVERGMRDAPRQIAGQDTQTPAQDYNKIYQKPAPSDEDAANDDTAPPPPTLNPQTTEPAATTAAPAPATTKPAPSAVTPAPQATVPATTKPAPVAATPTPTRMAAATPVAPPPVPKSAQPEAVATKPPAKLVTDTKPVETESAQTKPVEATPAPSIPAPSTPAPSTPAASSGGEYVLQIGSYKSEDDAAASWRAYKAKHSMAASYGESTKRADLGDKGTWYRLRIGGFASKEAAASFCAKLKADGGDCIPAKN